MVAPASEKKKVPRSRERARGKKNMRTGTERLIAAISSVVLPAHHRLLAFYQDPRETVQKLFLQRQGQITRHLS